MYLYSRLPAKTGPRGGPGSGGMELLNLSADHFTNEKMTFSALSSQEGAQSPDSCAHSPRPAGDTAQELAVLPRSVRAVLSLGPRPPSLCWKGGGGAWG